MTTPARTLFIVFVACVLPIHAALATPVTWEATGTLTFGYDGTPGYHSHQGVTMTNLPTGPFTLLLMFDPDTPCGSPGVTCHDTGSTRPLNAIMNMGGHTYMIPAVPGQNFVATDGFYPITGIFGHSGPPAGLVQFHFFFPDPDVGLIDQFGNSMPFSPPGSVGFIGGYYEQIVPGPNLPHVPTPGGCLIPGANGFICGFGFFGISFGGVPGLGDVAAGYAGVEGRFNPFAVPEPTTLVLLGVGLASLAARRRLQKRPHGSGII